MKKILVFIILFLISFFLLTSCEQDKTENNVNLTYDQITVKN